MTWEQLKADLDTRVCACGGELRGWTLVGDRGITLRGRDQKTEVPVDFECVRNHTWRDWVEVPRD